MALMSYLTRDRHGTYYFRRVIPAGLRRFMPAPWQGKANWKRSLRTKDPKEAKARTARLLSESTSDFATAERGQRGEPALTSSAVARFDATLLAELEAAAIRQTLEADEEQRREGDDRRHLQSPEERAGWSHLAAVPFGRKGMMDDHAEALGDVLEELAADYRKALSRSNPAIVSAELRAALRPLGLFGKLTPDEEHEAGMAVLRGTVKAYNLLLQRHAGEVVETPKPAADKGPKLSEAFEFWQTGSGARGARKPTGRTLEAARHAVRRFTEWHGDLRLGDVTKERARDFRDALSSVPTRLKKPHQALTLRQLVDRKVVGTAVHAGTVNKSLQLLGGIVSGAMAAGRMDGVHGYVNPFGKGIKIAIDARTKEDRKPFSHQDLAAIFSTAIYTGSERPAAGQGEAGYWLPLIALLMGMRQSEIAQLRLCDFAQDPDTRLWCFAIGTEGGRSVKTASSRRQLPIHPELERLGLLRYRQGLVDSGSAPTDPLWPGVESDGAAQAAAPWSKWINRWLRKKAGIADPRKVFHSFRHTWKRLCRDSGVSEELNDAIAGHSSGNQGRAYGQGFALTTLAGAMAKLEVPPAVKALPPWEPGKVQLPPRPRPVKVKLKPRQKP